ncbi:hypothetical protein PIB30_001400 [Stylosanthes scabra]|uniref:Uncharacterized protein n=1 Tax=Stylosanthes scabra TaxID=79078 RepID=A0ABU6Z1H2_9FABA|nr:hypothetical protein [Stylosanthes scabra]
MEKQTKLDHLKSMIADVNKMGPNAIILTPPKMGTSLNPSRSSSPMVVTSAFVAELIKPVPMGFNKQGLERKWPERAKGMKGSQQNLEGHCWTRCIRNREAMRTHLDMGGTSKRRIWHRCVRIKSLYAYASVGFSIYK